jgi:hypothetical protein
VPIVLQIEMFEFQRAEVFQTLVGHHFRGFHPERMKVGDLLQFGQIGVGHRSRQAKFTVGQPPGDASQIGLCRGQRLGVF